MRKALAMALLVSLLSACGTAAALPEEPSASTTVSSTTVVETTTTTTTAPTTTAVPTTVPSTTTTTQQPVTTTTAPSAGFSGRCKQWAATAIAAGWPRAQIPKVLRTIWRESRCNPRAFNPRGRDRSYGLLQMNMKANRAWAFKRCGISAETDLFNGYTNLRCAYLLYKAAGGWRPWMGGA